MSRTYYLCALTKEEPSSPYYIGPPLKLNIFTNVSTSKDDHPICCCFILARALALQSVHRKALDNIRGPLFPPFNPALILCFSLKACSNQKTYITKVACSAKNPMGRPLPRPSQPIWSP